MNKLHPIPEGRLRWEEVLPAGAHWSFKLRRGLSLRITDIDGGGNVSALIYHAALPQERYNMPDTLKAQHTAHLTRGHVLMSDMGRVLAAISGDTLGWHDPICGMTDADWVRQRFGEAGYQQHRNAMFRNARDGVLVELAKWGLTRRDVGSVVNFFSKVVADEAGALTLQPEHSLQGSAVELRMEADCIVVLAACQHPLDSSAAYAPKPVHLAIWESGTAPAADICRDHCPENGRAYINTERFYA